MNKDFYTQQLISRYNNPIRPQLTEALCVVDGISDPLEAWEQAVQLGLLPKDYLGVSNRRYCEANEGTTLWPTDRPEEKSQPRSMSAVLTVAADPNGMRQAERLAGELAARLVPWGAVCDDRIIWYFTNNSFEAHYLGHPYNSARNSVTFTLEKQGIDANSLMPTEEEAPLPLLVRRALGAWEGWEIAVQRAFELTEPEWVDLSQWQYFSELANPFAPLLDLWCTGYRLVCPFESEDPSIRLYANPVAVEAMMKP